MTEDVLPEPEDELQNFMQSKQEYMQQTLEKIVDYLRLLTKSPEHGQKVAEEFLTRLVQEGAIKMTLAIKLQKVIDNPDAKIEFRITENGNNL